ncbi:MAG: PEGA domain-containing protein [bacterium]|nr:PEGA domain-containing protein [bacterium]
MDKRAVFTIITFLVLILASTAAIAYNKGYRPNFDNKLPAVEENGLLAATSNPNGAQVFVNDHLITATDDTLTLPDGEYHVKIVKDGYIPWEKQLKVKKGVVTETQARLFPAASDLRAETSTGALLPTLSPDGTKLVYGVASGSAAKQGVWVMDLTERPLLAQAQSRQVAEDLAGTTFTWSPDSKQIIASTERVGFLLEADRLNTLSQNITPTINLILESWNKDTKTRENDRLGNLKPKLSEELKNIQIIAWSPDETKILYTATQSATLGPILETPPPGSSTQAEERNIKSGRIYVYDVKEDKNFFLSEKIPLLQKDQEDEKRQENQEEKTNPLDIIKKIGQSQRVQPIRWFPDSRHLIWVGETDISIVEYDGTNKNVIYSGPFENSFVYPWPNGSKILILTTYNRPAGVLPNLYSISLQ